jgi:carbon monoxide dehydrogenase subunit G
MNYQDTFTVEADRQAMWRFVSDVPRLLECLPGCRSVQAKGPNEYGVVVAQKVGPFQVQFDVNALVECLEGEQVIAARATGKDARGGNTAKVEIRLQLHDQDGDTAVTKVTVQSDLQVSGPLAQLGFGLMQHKAKEIFTGFAQAVRARGQELAGERP